MIKWITRKTINGKYVLRISQASPSRILEHNQFYNSSYSLSVIMIMKTKNIFRISQLKFTF